MKNFVRISRALFEREAAGRLTYRLSFVAELVAAAVYFVGIFYVGKLVPREIIEGNDYFTVTVIGVGFYGFISAVFSAPRNFLTGEINTGTFETLLSLGPSAITYVAAASFNRALRAFGRTAFVILVALWFGVNIHADRLAALLPVFLLSGMAALGGGMLHAAIDLRVRSTGRLIALAGGAGTILTGVYFPVSLLPEPLRHLSELLPTTHAIEAARSALVGGLFAWRPMAILSLLAVALFSAGFVALTSAVHRMRRDGSFSYY